MYVSKLNINKLMKHGCEKKTVSLWKLFKSAEDLIKANCKNNLIETDMRKQQRCGNVKNSRMLYSQIFIIVFKFHSALNK